MERLRVVAKLTIRRVHKMESKPRESVSVRNEIKQLYEKLDEYSASNVEVSVRLESVLSVTWSEYELISYILPYLDQITCGEWGLFYEIIFSGCICDNYGCGDVDDGSGTDAPSSSSTSAAAETTATPSSGAVESSTATSPSTGEASTQKPHDCFTVLH